ncbi:MAG: hypothetical protein JRG72_11295 [Deltaproteobacteria bacterium]|nr:hypothetical protein [Deltaproteobacteria bacterium]
MARMGVVTFQELGTFLTHHVLGGGYHIGIQYNRKEGSRLQELMEVLPACFRGQIQGK